MRHTAAAAAAADRALLVQARHIHPEDNSIRAKRITHLDTRGHRFQLGAGIDAPGEVGPVDGQRLQVKEALLLAPRRRRRRRVRPAATSATSSGITSIADIAGGHDGEGRGAAGGTTPVAEGRGGDARQRLDDSGGSTGLLPQGVGRGRGEGAKVAQEGLILGR